MPLLNVFFTVNFWGEGDRDTNWLKHIYDIYHVQEIKVHFNNAHGGSPVDQIKKMNADPGAGGYDRRVSMFDTDRGEEEVKLALALAEKDDHGVSVQCIKCDKNIECELLKILGVSGKKLTKAKGNTHIAKRLLKEQLGLKDEDEAINWKRFFPKPLLDEARKTNSWLDEIIKVMTTK